MNPFEPVKKFSSDNSNFAEKEQISSQSFI